MRKREEQLILKATSLINDYIPGSLVGLDYKSQIGPSYDLIRDLFYRSDHSKWSVMKSYAFITENQISPEVFISFLDELFTQRYSGCYFQNGSKAAFKFVNTLKGSKRFKPKIETRPRVNYLNQEEYTQFINELRCFKEKYIRGISQNKWIELITKNFEMQNAPSTFRKDYHELRLKG
jgi:hypothetical protein